MKKIHVVCPICGKSKFMPIPRDIFTVDEGYLLKYPIRAGEICDHKFICCVDYNFKIRDYETGAGIEKYFTASTQKPSAADYSYF